MKRQSSPPLRLLPLLVACAVAAGCGKKTPPEKVPVEGKLLHANGKPVTNLVLRLHPQEDVNKTDSPSDVLSKEGTFHFNCLPGRYKATLAPIPLQGHATPGPGAAPGPGPVSTPKLPGGIPAKYLSATESDLTVDVPAGGTKDVVLKLK